MVKVTKIAVWKIENSYYENAKAAEAAARRIILRDFLSYEGVDLDEDQLDSLADKLIDNWDSFQQQVAAAMSGT